MTDETVEMSNGEVILEEFLHSSDPGSEYYKLLQHRGHTVEIVTYGPKDNSIEIVSKGEVWNVSLECTQCFEVVLDYENEFDEGTEFP